MSFSGTANSSKYKLANTVNQSDLYRDTLKSYQKGSEAQFDALDAIKVSKVSFAREFEDFRQLPKYSHIPLAVIHPSPVKRVQKPRRPSPDFELQSSPQRMVTRPTFRQDIPESLVRPPVQVTAGGKKRPKSSLGFGSSTSRFGTNKASRSKVNFAERIE